MSNTPSEKKIIEYTEFNIPLEESEEVDFNSIKENVNSSWTYNSKERIPIKITKFKPEGTEIIKTFVSAYLIKFSNLYLIVDRTKSSRPILCYKYRSKNEKIKANTFFKNSVSEIKKTHQELRERKENISKALSDYETELRSESDSENKSKLKTKIESIKESQEDIVSRMTCLENDFNKLVNLLTKKNSGDNDSEDDITEETSSTLSNNSSTSSNSSTFSFDISQYSDLEFDLNTFEDIGPEEEERLKSYYFFHKRRNNEKCFKIINTLLSNTLSTTSLSGDIILSELPKIGKTKSGNGSFNLSEDQKKIIKQYAGLYKTIPTLQEDIRKKLREGEDDIAKTYSTRLNCIKMIKNFMYTSGSGILKDYFIALPFEVALGRDMQNKFNFRMQPKTQFRITSEKPCFLRIKDSVLTLRNFSDSGWKGITKNYSIKIPRYTLWINDIIDITRISVQKIDSEVDVDDIDI